MKARQGLPYLGFDTPPPAAVSYALPVVALAHDLRITPGELVLPVRHYLTDDFIEGVHVEAWQVWLNPPVDRPLPSLGLSQCLETPPTELKRQLGSYTRSGRLIALVGDRDAGTRNSLAGHVSDLEIQGFTLLNLIHNNFLAPVGLTGALLVTVGAALWVGLWGAGVNLAGASLAAAFGAVGRGALNDGAVTRPGVMLPLVAPLLSQLSAYGVVMWLHLHSSSRHRRRVVAAARDCCPTDPLPIREEQRRVLTVLLWDLRSYVESDPGLLREYFACAKRVLEYFGGLVLDYADCTQVVVFGLGDGSHALPACQAAAGLVAEAQARPGLPPNRLSIATGELEIRAAEGRSVASGIAVRSARLANLAKLSDWEVRLTPATWMACDGQLPALVAGSVRVPLYVLRVEELVREWRREEAFPWHPKEGPAALTLGGHFNGYRLDRVIGQGGMGRVFQAEDTRLLRKVALKVVIGSLKAGQSKRFLQEARAVARVHHPSIIAIYEFGLEPFPYIVMEYVPGQDLSTLLEHKQSQPWAWVVDVVARVLDALTVVHGQGIIHRDLKPSNIMVTPEGQVKLMDFGLARFTEESTRLSRTGQICGTPRYMAPEHLESEFGKVDEVSDLFAVAATLYELLTGVTPVKGETMPTILYDLIYGQPEPPHVVNPSVPENVSRACLKGLQKQKADRYLTAQEFAAALRSCVDVR